MRRTGDLNRGRRQRLTQNRRGPHVLRFKTQTGPAAFVPCAGGMTKDGRARPQRLDTSGRLREGELAV